MDINELEAAEQQGVPEENAMEHLKREREEYLSGWQRTKADFANYKKEELQRLQNAASRGAQDVVTDLLAVLDSFSLAIAALEKTGPVEQGIYMIRVQLEDVLRKRGLNRISIAPGSPFDPAVAEAIAEMDSAQHPPGSVVREIEPGYELNGKLLRPARVILAKEKEEAETK